MRSVRISWRSAQWLLTLVRAAKAGDSCSGLLLGKVSLDAARELDAGLKPRPALRLAKARRETKRLTKKEHRRDVRAQVMARAQGQCELCCTCETRLNPLELHHALGRVKVKESQANCLALCPVCHRRITNAGDEGPALYREQAELFLKHGHGQTAKELMKLADWEEAKINARVALEAFGCTP